MEKCQKCSGVMLQMKSKQSATLHDSEKKQVWKCSRCGLYVEKQQTFFSDQKKENNDPYYIRHRP